MTFLWGKNVQNSISAGASPQTSYGELTTALLRWWSLQRSLYDPWLHLRGPTSKGRGKEEEGGRKAGSKKGVWAPQSSPQIDTPGCKIHAVDVETMAVLATGIRGSSPPPIMAPAPPEFLCEVIHCSKE